MSTGRTRLGSPMVGPVALVGGDEFRAGCREMDLAILEATGKERPSVLILPTAAARQNPSKAASNGVAHFSALGADASTSMVVEPEDANDEELVRPVDRADVVYLTGGDPAHLLRVLSGSALLERIEAARARGAAIAGSSAGAMVMGPWMRYREWRAALGLVEAVTLPHHERSDPESVSSELIESAPGGLTTLGIDAMTACVIGDEGWSVLGPGRVIVYRGGRWESLTTGDGIVL